jgi:sulfate transport system permease protein
VLRRIPGPALGATYLSLLVLLPVAALFTKAFNGGLSAFWDAVSESETVAALKLTLVTSLLIVVVNSVAGTAIAWLLVRDERFATNRLIGWLVDLPFAMPTIVAGVVLISVYGSGSPFHIDIAYTRAAVVVAIAFVTLPFSVRSVQPVLAALDLDTEEAAASLGATPWTSFWRVTLPSLLPAILTGAGLAFARACGEYGSVSLFSGNLPFKTEVASVRIFGLIESDAVPAAAAVSLVLFAMSLVVLAVFGFIRAKVLPVEADR